MKKLKLIVLSALVFTFGLYGSALAQKKNSIELRSTSEVEVTITNEKGEKETRLVDAAKARVVPGDQVIYTNYYTNKGKDIDKNAVITNRVPEHMVYVDKSAIGKNTSITFSVDNGKTFRKPDELTILGADGKKRPAKASDYTHIRWKLKESLSPDGSGHVRFRAKLE